MTIGKKIGVGVGTTLVITLLIGGLSFWRLMDFIISNRWVAHTHLVLQDLENLLSLTKDVETGQRGYLLCGKSEFLAPYREGLAGIKKTKDDLRKLISDNADQTELFDRELEPLIAARLKFAQDVVGAGADSKEPAKDFAAAIEMCKTGTGKKLMDDIRRKVHDMQKIERDLLKKRQADAEWSAMATLVTIGLGTLAAIAIMAVGGTMMTRSITIPVRAAADQLATCSAEILASTTQQASGAREQAAAVTQTMATVDEVAQTADQASQRAKAVGESVQRTLEIGKSGRKVVDESLVAMESVKEKVEATAENILTLAEQAQAISDIIATVNDIAEQTNLLALNAAIEASRAGEHGRGFTVVASEVKALADQSKKATAQVKRILGEIQKATNTAVLSTEEVTRGVAGAIKVGGQAGETIKTLADTLAEVARAATQIVASVSQQATGMTQIHQAMKSIDQVAKQNSVATRQAAQAAENLNQMGLQLTTLIGK